MRVDCSLLCDSVTIREGLIHLLGGGVTRITRPSYPAQLGVALAVRVMVHPTETAEPHILKCILMDTDGERIAEFDVGFKIDDPGTVLPGEECSVPFALPLANVALMMEGAHSFELLVDGVHQVSVPFVAVTMEIPLPFEEGNPA